MNNTDSSKIFNRLLDQSLKQIANNQQLRLYEVEVALYSYEDPNTAFDIFPISIAAEDEKAAIEYAYSHVTDNFNLESDEFIEPVNGVYDITKDYKELIDKIIYSNITKETLKIVNQNKKNKPRL